MNTTKLREIQRFLQAWRLQEGDMSLQRLETLIAVALREGNGIDQSALITAGKFRRSATSKNVASWTSITALKKKGPGYLKSDLDPMNLKSRIISITTRGKAALTEALTKARLEESA